MAGASGDGQRGWPPWQGAAQPAPASRRRFSADDSPGCAACLQPQQQTQPQTASRLPRPTVSFANTGASPPTLDSRPHSGSAYQPLTSRAILAGRIRLGTILGAPRDQIAPSRRFYAGGGASVRGYGFQSIGPRDPNNDPIGGRSLAEFAIEARVKAFGNFGVVPFLDGGNIYTGGAPDFSGFRYGAGLGVRYYSSFGPIRVDVGTPLNPQQSKHLGLAVELAPLLSHFTDAPTRVRQMLMMGLVAAEPLPDTASRTFVPGVLHPSMLDEDNWRHLNTLFNQTKSAIRELVRL